MHGFEALGMNHNVFFFIRIHFIAPFLFQNKGCRDRAVRRRCGGDGAERGCQRGSSQGISIQLDSSIGLRGEKMVMK